VSYGLDTSVLVRLLVGEPAELAAKAKGRLLQAHRLRQVVVASDLVIAEAWYALRHHYGSEPDEIRQALRAMLSSGLVQPEPGSAVLSVLSSPASAKVGFADRLIHAHYQADGLTTLSLDKAQARLGRTEYIG
jgi:predicted nucleic-acid-binding protein